MIQEHFLQLMQVAVRRIRQRIKFVKQKNDHILKAQLFLFMHLNEVLKKRVRRTSARYSHDELLLSLLLFSDLVGDFFSQRCRTFIHRRIDVCPYLLETCQRSVLVSIFRIVVSFRYTRQRNL